MKRFGFRNNRWPFNQKYPNGWRGAMIFAARLHTSVLRAQWVYVRRENDWMRVDTAARVNVAPRWAKWLSITNYHCYKGIWHVKLGRLVLSYLPGCSIPEVL